MTPRPARPDTSEDPVVRVLGSYLAAVAASVSVLMLIDAVERKFEPPLPPLPEPVLPYDWISLAIMLVMIMLYVTVTALPAFLLCLAFSVRLGLRHPAIHVACGCGVGLMLGRLFAPGYFDRPVQVAAAGAVGGAVYWRLPVRNRRPARP